MPSVRNSFIFDDIQNFAFTDYGRSPFSNFTRQVTKLNIILEKHKYYRKMKVKGLHPDTFHLLITRIDAYLIWELLWGSHPP